MLTHETCILFTSIPCDGIVDMEKFRKKAVYSALHTQGIVTGKVYWQQVTLSLHSRVRRGMLGLYFFLSLSFHSAWDETH